MNEAVTRREYVTADLQGAGCGDAPNAIGEQRRITDGKPADWWQGAVGECAQAEQNTYRATSRLNNGCLCLLRNQRTARDEMKESYQPILLQLRVIVGFLGERTQCAWWPTAFYETSGRLFLEPVFSKTSRLAQYHGVLEAARRLHDEHLSVGSYHLFRLPEEIEQDLHAMVQGGGGEELASEVVQSKETALEALKRLAATSDNSSVGPTAVGSIKDLDSAETLKTIAAAYLSAFNKNAKTYPYLVG
ncbi:BrxE family protein [Paraburkholderia sp. A1RO-1]|uniref:BrxE family protein n=1 Tax=unclassified Paraburkholderia TaxID=2615204 RepID=UPI003B80E887